MANGLTLCAIVVIVFAGALAASAADAGKAAAPVGDALAGGEPLRLHPDNPHYFLFRGKPTVLITSGEHYGAVMNLDFNYKPYLDELKARGLNYTRLFSGVYRESWGAPFNTLNPPKGRYLTPWARSNVDGYIDGGNKFDLDRWDPAYTERLRDYITEAGRRGVVVEITLFCQWYDDAVWNLSPLNSRNNTNGGAGVPRASVNTLKNGDLLARQEAMLRHIVTAVNDLDNLFFEICNEPGAADDWMDHMANLVWEIEGKLPNRHIIANNEHAVPHMGVFNIHYDRDCKFLRDNFARNIVVGYDETGFDGASDTPYRRQGWNFILNGGGLYDNLDFSFSVAHPDGTETTWDKKLCGGSPDLRTQLGILKKFIDGMDFVKMRPARDVVKGGAPKAYAALAEPGKQYAIYLDGGESAELSVDLPAGSYKAEWVNTMTGAVDKAERFDHAGGPRAVASPPYKGEIALRILREKP